MHVKMPKCLYGNKVGMRVMRWETSHAKLLCQTIMARRDCGNTELEERMNPQTDSGTFGSVLLQCISVPFR